MEPPIQKLAVLLRYRFGGPEFPDMDFGDQKEILGPQE